MSRVVSASLCNALACAAMAGACAHAAEAQPNRFDFRTLEYRYDEDAALAAARTDLAARYPLGSSAAEAARGIAAGGARCRPAGEATRCDYASFEAKDDSLIEVDWTVRIEPDANGALRALAVDRSTWGF